MSELKPQTSEPLPLRSAIVTSIQWDRVFEFTHLFRGFRLAINPAKLMIALLAIVMIYSAGRLFDLIWGPQVYGGEIGFFQIESANDFRERRPSQIESRRSSIDFFYRNAFRAGDSFNSPDEAHIKDLKDHPRAAYREIKNMYLDNYAKDIAQHRKTRQESVTFRATLPNPPTEPNPYEIETQANAASAHEVLDHITNLRKAIGTGIFAGFLDYELRQFDALVNNTLTFVRITPVRPAPGAGGSDFDPETASLSTGIVSLAPDRNLRAENPDRFWRSDTITGSVANMTITGPYWLFAGAGPIQYRSENLTTWAGFVQTYSFRGLYILSLVIFLLFCLATLALSGGMISRLSALEIAGVERPLLKDVFLFVRRRLAVFIKVPLAPIVILLVLGAGMGVLGLIGAIPFVGEILLGIFFILFLAIAFVLMLLVLGLLGGFHLLYPTLAVEGSDTFDAMSRAFAYVYARPWRLGFYTLISLLYGVITLLFVSFAVYIILALTHTFAGWGTSLFGYNLGWHSGSPKLDTLWPAPHFGHLINPANWYAMSTTEYIGALCLHFWSFLLISTIGAYVLSYYFSAHTMIYLLIRRSVDGQSLSEVCPNDPEAPKPAAPAAPSTAAAPAAPATTTPAPEPPAAPTT